MTNGNAGAGGGIYCGSSYPTLKNNIIRHNKATDGGGIYCEYQSPIITGNIISENTAVSFGGGIECSVASPTITSNVISKNTCGLSGGGIGCWEADPVVTNNIISGNVASASGGGIGGGSSSPTVSNNTITDNSSAEGGGLYYHFSSMPTVTNTVIWNNNAPTGSQASISNYSVLSISYSDIEGGQSSIHVGSGCTINWGPGMLDSNPLFVDTAVEDLHIQWNSACKDSGVNAAVYDLFDFESDPRIAGGVVDIGADEFYRHLYCTGNLNPGASVEIKVVGEPYATPVRLALGSGLQDPPLSTQYGDLYLALPLWWQTDFGSIPANGVLIHADNLPAVWHPGDERVFQALIGPLGSSSSRLTNLMLLTVE